jgi:hypothetical protein
MPRSPELSLGPRIAVGLFGLAVLGCLTGAAIIGGYSEFLQQLWNPDYPMANCYGWRLISGAFGLVAEALGVAGLVLIGMLCYWVATGKTLESEN